MIDLDCIVNSETIIQKSHDSIQRRKSDTKPIKDLENCPINSLHSICGVITSISETKPRGDKIIRVIEVVDESEMVIEINFWGNLTQILDEFEVGQNVQFDNLQLCSFNYKHMTYTGCSSFNELPCSDETRLLTQKIEENNYELPNTQRYSDSIPSSFPIMSLKEFEENARNANGDHFKAIVTGYITAFRTDAISYIGCNNCKKKVDIDVIVCSNCKNQKCTPQHQYNLKVEIQDSTNKIWGTMFDEVATKFMGISAEKLADLKESNFDNYIISFRSKSFTKVELGLQGKLNGKGGVSTTIFHCQILDEDETN
ncbi:Replication factor A protein 1 [Entamoeba marina]